MLKTHNTGELRAGDAGKTVTITGWLDAFRLTGKISFILLRDRTGVIQVFVNKELTAEHQHALKPESVLLIKGKVNKRPANQVKADMPTGEIEIEATEIQVLSQAETPLPVDLLPETTTAIDKRLDYRFLDVRRESVKDIFLIRGKIVAKSYEFFEKEGFVNIQTPKLTAAGVESGAEEFKLPYFGKTASLAQSPQIYKQMFVVSGLEKVYCIEPVFRAEKSHTTRHVTEFTGLDFEFGFIESEEDIMKFLEKYFQFLLSEIKTFMGPELNRLNVTIDVPHEIPRLSLYDARKILSEKGKIIPENEDLDSEGEKMIGAYVKEKYNSDFVFMLDYPWTVRPFYHMKKENDPKSTKSIDVLYKGVEIASGGQREHRLDILMAQCQEKGLDLNKLPFFRDIFRYGAPPHGGMGLGVDRIVKQMLNLENAKEAILLPRDPERLTP